MSYDYFLKQQQQQQQQQNLYYHHQQQQQQQQQTKITHPEMDLSVLWCLGPDFENSSVFNLHNENNYIESNWSITNTTSNWLMSSPTQWTQTFLSDTMVYTPRSVVHELEPQSPLASSIKRPLSDVSNRISSKILN